jgi:nucleoside-triphosphatase
MLVVITGAIGVGKTTICQKVIDITRSQGYGCAGMITCKAPDGGIIIEDVKTGQRMTLASLNSIYDGPQVGKYFFNPEGIEFGIRAIESGKDSSLLVVDEIGPLELKGGGFVRALELIKDGKVRDCIIVIRSGLVSTFLPQLGTTPLIFETTVNNRDQLPTDIALASGFLAHKRRPI